jgi:hypothetical protein
MEFRFFRKVGTTGRPCVDDSADALDRVCYD